MKKIDFFPHLTSPTRGEEIVNGAATSTPLTDTLQNKNKNKNAFKFRYLFYIYK